MAILAILGQKKRPRSVAFLQDLGGAGKEIHHARRHQLVVHDIAIATIRYDAVRSQYRQVLRYSGLIGANHFREFAHRAFAPIQSIDNP